MNKNQASLSVSAVLSKPFKILLLLMCFSIPLSSGAVELNGYYFGSDSADIWENKYFTQYDPSGPTPLFLYGSRLLGGYGGFGFWLAQFFDETDTYTFVDDAGIERTINCVVRREHGYWPDYIAHQIGGGYKLDEDHAAGSTSVTLAHGIEPVAWEHGICRVNGSFYEYGSRTNTSFLHDGRVKNIRGMTIWLKT